MSKGRLNMSYDHGLNMALKMEHVKGFQKYLRGIVINWIKDRISEWGKNQGQFSIIWHKERPGKQKCFFPTHSSPQAPRVGRLLGVIWTQILILSGSKVFSCTNSWIAFNIFLKLFSEISLFNPQNSPINYFTNEVPETLTIELVNEHISLESKCPDLLHSTLSFCKILFPKLKWFSSP